MSVTILAVLIAVTFIYLVTSLKIDESRSTIPMLKVLGFRRLELIKLILNSVTPYLFIGFWLGMPLMLVFGNTISNYFQI